MSEIPAWLNQDLMRRNQAIEVAAHAGDLMVCPRCAGTGNELYRMYRQCSDCEGTGVVEQVFPPKEDDT